MTRSGGAGDLLWLANADGASPWAQATVLVTGLGVSGFAAADGLLEFGARVIVVAEEGDAEAAAASDVMFEMPAGLEENLTPFLYKLPFEYLTCYMAYARGVAFLGFDDPNRQEVNFRQIFRSQLQATR